MAFPGFPLASNKTNATPQTDDHPGHHAALAVAVNDLQAQVDSIAASVPLSVIDAKGDLIAGTADNTVARRPVGPDGQVLTADSAQGTGIAYKGGLVKIEEITASGTVAVFSDIPADFRHLLVEGRIIHNNASGANAFRILGLRFNGNTESIYDTNVSYVADTTPVHAVANDAQHIIAGYIGQVFGSLVCNIPNYKGGGSKTAHSVGSGRTGSSTAATRNVLGSDGLWQSGAAIAAEIRFLIISGGADEFGANSVFSLYGLG